MLARRLGLRADLQRTLVGFMGCSAAVPALRIAQATVLADPAARVLVVNLELCTLHLQETDNVEVALSFLLFGDGCTAALVTAEAQGIALGDFRTAFDPRYGGAYHLAYRRPGVSSCISPARCRRKSLRRCARTRDLFCADEGTQAIDLWAVHGGGRTVLDAVQTGLSLGEGALAPSRAVLAAHGNMSSATIMFVLAGMLETASPGQRGLAMAFGPGMVAETFRFTVH